MARFHHPGRRRGRPSATARKEKDFQLSQEDTRERERERERETGENKQVSVVVRRVRRVRPLLPQPAHRNQRELATALVVIDIVEDERVRGENFFDDTISSKGGIFSERNKLHFSKLSRAGVLLRSAIVIKAPARSVGSQDLTNLSRCTLFGGSLSEDRMSQSE